LDLLGSCCMSVTVQKMYLFCFALLFEFLMRIRTGRLLMKGQEMKGLMIDLSG